MSERKYVATEGPNRPEASVPAEPSVTAASQEGTTLDEINGKLDLILAALKGKEE